MSRLPRLVSEAWEDREGPAVFGTVDTEGTANLVYVNCVWKLNEEQFVIADNYFHKTRANMDAGSRGSLLFLTSKRKSYQVKGAIHYHTSGKIYDTMRLWNADIDPNRPGVGATVIRVEEVYCGAEKLV